MSGFGRTAEDPLSQPTTLEQITAILQSDEDLSPKVRDALCELITVAYNQFSKSGEAGKAHDAT